MSSTQIYIATNKSGFYGYTSIYSILAKVCWSQISGGAPSSGLPMMVSTMISFSSNKSSFDGNTVYIASLYICNTFQNNKEEIKYACKISLYAALV